MPLYEYDCSDCKTQFEQLVAASNKEDGVECPECGSVKVERLVSAFAIGNSDNSSASEFSCPTCNLG